MEYTPAKIQDELNRVMNERRKIEHVIWLTSDLSEFWQMKLVDAVRAHYDPIITMLDKQMQVAMWWLEQQNNKEVAQ